MFSYKKDLKENSGSNFQEKPSRISNKISSKIFLTAVCHCLAASTIIASPLALVFTPSAQAQSRRVRYVPPSNLDAPKVSASGITRSACQANESICLIALLPDLQLESRPVPQTVSEHPTIYFLSPKFDGKASFTIREVHGSTTKFFYSKAFPLKIEAGIIALKVPNDAPTLEIGKIYRFELTSTSSSLDDKNVRGYIQRILPSPNLVDQLKNTSNPIDRAALYAQAGIWFETMETLAEAQRTLPQNTEITEEWLALLRSAKLDRVLPFSFVTQIPTKEAKPVQKQSESVSKPYLPYLP
jgi:hypothetical protein